MFVRRLGKNSSQCPAGHTCPQILEKTDRNFAAVGLVITEEARKAMLPGPGIGTNEAVVEIPRRVMIEAMQDLLSTV